MKKLLMIVPALLLLSGCDWMKMPKSTTPSIQSTDETTQAKPATQPATNAEKEDMK